MVLHTLQKANELIDGGKRSCFPVLQPSPQRRCGYVHLCEECEFKIRGGWDGVLPDDAAEWWPRDDCPACQSAAQAYQDLREHWLDPGPIGYAVDGRTVRREDFLGLLTLLDMAAALACEYLAKTGATASRINQFRFTTRDSIAQLMEAVYRGTDDPNDAGLRPAGIFGGSLPPCPLTVK